MCIGNAGNCPAWAIGGIAVVEPRYLFPPHVVAVFRRDRLALVDIRDLRTHLISGSDAHVLAKFVSATRIAEVLATPGCSAQAPFEILRLLKIQLLVQEGDEGPFPEVAFWEDALTYHALSRTVKNSRFMPRWEQHERFIEGAVCTQQVTLGSNMVLLPHPPDGCARDFLQVLSARRSRRTFAKDDFSSSDLALITREVFGNRATCFRADTSVRVSLRAAPSAGGLQSIELYCLVRNVNGLMRGVYRYEPELHALAPVPAEITDEWLFSAFAAQDWPLGAAVVMVLVGNPTALTIKYDVSRVYKMLFAEAGHFSQNVLLCAEYLGKAACVFGASNEQLIEEKLGFKPAERIILLLIGIGGRVPGDTLSDWVDGAVVRPHA